MSILDDILEDYKQWKYMECPCYVYRNLIKKDKIIYLELHRRYKYKSVHFPFVYKNNIIELRRLEYGWG
jgi:hypothetical protein